jgi:hypothetical protein
MSDSEKEQEKKPSRRRIKASGLPKDWKPGDSGVVLDDDSRTTLDDVLALPEPAPED